LRKAAPLTPRLNAQRRGRDMPPPRKIDRLPSELRDRLIQSLTSAGFGNIVAITEELNFWLEDEGLELSIGKSAVGEFSQALKSQKEAFALAETLLQDMDIERESDMHRVLMQMIATSAVQFMKTMTEAGKPIDPAGLMSLGRMLKDLMHSVGLREKVRSDERERIAKAAKAEAADTAVNAMRHAGMSDKAVEDAKARILGISA